MKTILFLIFTVITVNIYSQTFTFVRIDPYPVYDSAGGQLKSHAVLHNLTNQNIPVTCRIKNRQVTQGWDSIGMCTWVNCYAAGWYVQTDTLRPNSTDTFYVYFTPNNIPGSGSCTVTMSYQATTLSQDFAVVAWPIGIKQISSAVKGFTLNQNYPNPFNPSTKIRFSIPSYDYVNLQVYDMLGRAVQTLINSNLMPGEYEVEFDASNIASGIYYYRLQAGNNTEIRKLTLVK